MCIVSPITNAVYINVFTSVLLIVKIVVLGRVAVFTVVPLYTKFIAKIFGLGRVAVTERVKSSTAASSSPCSLCSLPRSRRALSSRAERVKFEMQPQFEMQPKMQRQLEKIIKEKAETKKEELNKNEAMVQRHIKMSLHDEIKAMEQIEGLKVPSDGGFMANNNDRKKREEERKIDMDKNMFNLKEKIETKKEEKEEPEQIGKEKVRKQEEMNVSSHHERSRDDSTRRRSNIKDQRSDVTCWPGEDPPGPSTALACPEQFCK